MDFIYLLRILLKKKWIILGATVLATAIAYFFTRNEERKYRSTAQVSTGFTISDDIKINNENFSFYEADTKFNNVIVTATSPSVISLLSYKLILHDIENPKPFRQLNAEKKKTPLYREIDLEKAKTIFRNKLESMTMLTSFKEDEKRLLELLKLYQYDYRSIIKNLNVYRLQRTDYLQIDFTSENPELSAFVVNTTFQQFLHYYKNIRSSDSQESIDTLRSLLEKKKQELDAKNNLLRGEGMLDVGQGTSSKLELIMNLETTLTEEKSKRTVLVSSLQKVNQKLAGLGTTSTGSIGNNNNDELLILRKAMNDAYDAYVNSGSSDQALYKRYTTLKAEYQSKALNAQGPRLTDNSKSTDVMRSELLEKKADLEVDIRASDGNIESIQSKINGLRSTVIQDASKGAVIESLLKDAELANKEYLTAKEKYNEATDIGTATVNNFRQILMGQPAIDPEPSKKLLIIGLSGTAVFVISILIIVIMTYLDSSVKTPDIFSRVVNLKLISMVNFMNLKQRDLADIVANKSGSDDVADKKRHNVFRESIRKLRYEIESSGKKIFLFTSTKKGQGKTTLIQALSYSMSLSKKKILIIDTNFCNNDLTIQLSANPILEKIDPYKKEGQSLLEQVKKVAKDIGVGTVFAIGSEGGDYTPSEILPRENLLHHLHELVQEFDYIFLEGPPLNDFSDSKELAQYVDGVIAVFSAVHIIKQIDKESITFFKGLGDKFVGSILNMVDLENVNVS